MPDTFASRIPTLTDVELLAYLQEAGRFKAGVVELAAAELRRRGHDLAVLEWERIQRGLQARDAAHIGPPPPATGFLYDQDGPRLRRIHGLVAAIAGAGLSASALIYRFAAADQPLPYALDPNNSKRYLREMEVIGGKANLMAYDFNQWFASLWRGRTLAFSVAWITLFLAGSFWFLATRQPRQPPQPPERR
jgi:hypothetical protein